MLLALFCPPPTAPPFVELGVTVKEGLRMWSLLPLTIMGPLTDGTAGIVGFLPFTGEIASAGGAPPTAVDIFEGSVAFGGKDPLVADAYDERPGIGAGADDEFADALGELRACTEDCEALVVSG